MELLTLITIGLALSMDAFSVSLGVGTLALTNKKNLIIASIIGIMHFIMPLLGLLIGDNLVFILHINAHILMSGILLLIAFEMIRDVITCNEKELSIGKFGIMAFAFSVSFDSFTTGIGLGSITKNCLLASIIFAIISFLFTYLGLNLGKYSHKLLGIYANIIGAILLVVVATVSFFL